MSNEPLLAAACSVFAARGYTDATMSAIAERAQTTKPTLYKRFQDKQTLYTTCLSWETDHAQAYLFAAYERAASMSADEEIAWDMRAFFDYARDRPDGFRLLLEPRVGDPATNHREQLVEALIARLSGQITRRSRGDTDPVTVRQLAAMAVGVAFHAAREALLVSHTDPSSAADLAAAFVTAGLHRVR